MFTKNKTNNETSRVLGLACIQHRAAGAHCINASLRGPPPAQLNTTHASGWLKSTFIELPLDPLLALIVQNSQGCLSGLPVLGKPMVALELCALCGAALICAPKTQANHPDVPSWLLYVAALKCVLILAQFCTSSLYTGSPRVAQPKNPNRSRVLAGCSP